MEDSHRADPRATPRFVRLKSSPELRQFFNEIERAHERHRRRTAIAHRYGPVIVAFAVTALIAALAFEVIHGW